MKHEYDREDMGHDLEAAALLDAAAAEIAEKTGVHWKHVLALAFIIRKRAEVFDIVLPRPQPLVPDRRT